MTGRGSSGSWQIRGEQLGRAIGATVLPRAIDVGAFDVAVVVKRPPADLVHRIHGAGMPLVWDVVDSWPQPDGNTWSRDECMAWLRDQVRRWRPTAIVAATRAMERDCEEFDVPVLALPHHARPGLVAAAIRPLRVVGYEGGAQHLGSWGPRLELECRRRGWSFVVNPPSVAECDVLVALRERRGYAPLLWKSNVKLANAQAAGVPIICAREAGYVETASGAEVFADTLPELVAAFDLLEPASERLARTTTMLRATPTIDSIATDYLRWLKSL